MASELKPCPFCGGSNLSFRSTPDMDTDGKYHRISCNECGASSRATFAMDACPLFYEELSKAWNTRPAPAATDTGLETVGYAHRGTIGLLLEGAVSKAIIVPKAGGDFKTPVMLVERADELLAEEIRRERDLAEKQLSEVVDRMSDDYLALKAELDQAVGVIEDRSSEYEALEAKLAAAEKALEPFVSFFNEAMKGFTEGYAERTPSDKPVLGWNNAYLLMQHFIEARATLGGKPS